MGKLTPTQEQIKEFWEWCGFSLRTIPHRERLNGYTCHWELDGIAFKTLPPIDLNNLFKYAVPKLQWFIVTFEHIEVSCDYYVTLTDFYLAEPCREYKSQHKDPTLALFWAIWEVIHNE